MVLIMSLDEDVVMSHFLVFKKRENKAQISVVFFSHREGKIHEILLPYMFVWYA